jgi:hypothetical protein
VSLNSGKDIYNRALITGTDAAGASFKLMRPTPPPPGARLLPIANGPVATNPSLTTNLTGWQVGDSSSFSVAALARDTGSFATTPASAHLTSNLGANAQIDVTTWVRVLLNAGYTFKAGINYVAVVSMAVTQHTTGGGPPAAGSLFFGEPNDMGALTYAYGPLYVDQQPGSRGRTDLNPFFPTPTLTPVFRDVAVSWAPQKDIDSGVVYMDWVAGKNPFFPNGVWFDDVKIYRSAATLVDRRGFARTMQLPVDSAMPAGDDGPAGTIADIWLGDHRSTPFRGSISVVGDAAIRETLTGQNVSAGTLLTRTNEIIRLMDSIDPDTGGLGREGRITAVSYAPATATAQVTLDSSRDNLSALLARIALITDNTR